MTADDCRDVAVAWKDGGTKPVARALAAEGFYGPHTVRVVVVGKGGSALNSTQLAALEKHFNGDPVAGTSGVLVLNNEATVENHVPHSVDVWATVEGDDLDAESLEAAIAAFLDPLYLRSDGEWQHAFGGEVTRSKLIDVIHSADENVRNVTINTPAADVALAANELPEPGATINVVLV